MHDPNTQVLSLGSLVRIWHVDPCADGTDDSCGWSAPKLSKHLRGLIDFEAGCEARDPWFQREMAKLPQNVADTEHLLRGAILGVAHMAGLKCDYRRARDIAARLLHNPVDNVRRMMCFAPGYHTNTKVDSEAERQDHARTLYRCIARYLLTDARPWWRHPRWHVAHWRIEFPFMRLAIGRKLGRVGDYA